MKIWCPNQLDDGSIKLVHLNILFETVVGPKGIEPSHLTALEPKSSASTYSATGPRYNHYLTVVATGSHPGMPIGDLFPKCCQVPVGMNIVIPTTSSGYPSLAWLGEANELRQ